ncbi:PP2C family protein-serine/threonine phosphatase [Oceanidesulfovibrio marinus]|uniref:PPM-type phosphatase domain-containing protein n=1 Tax=Oceanidesulfovibrio marinus TaxID=370038 RepID=A0ABX6NHG9_9BACT|nr:protein phosphatase 2C domain-containing protein [Oceanidesulfovibrio marinus]QJT09503.1 hypothetical protein E8L03_11380 [Oceanidesulfovibrio marinus]
MDTYRAAVQSSIYYWMLRTCKEKGSVTAPGQIALGTTKGSVRNDNQDRAAVLTFFPNERLSDVVQVAVLCDGIGGLKDGANVAALAISSFTARVIELSDSNMTDCLKKAANHANKIVFDKYEGKGGCTLSAVSINRSGLIEIVNYGDSRVYLQSEKSLTQLSSDDTLDGQLAKMDRKIDAPLPEFKHLVQFIGMEGELDTSPIDITKVKDGDRILLASDGAYNVDFSTMESLLLNSTSTEDGIKKLLLLSEWIGGKDNATAIYAPAFSNTEGYKSMSMTTFEICTWNSSYIFSVDTILNDTTTKEKEVQSEKSSKDKNKKKTSKKKKIQNSAENRNNVADNNDNDDEVIQIQIEFDEGEAG